MLDPSQSPAALPRDGQTAVTPKRAAAEINLKSFPILTSGDADD